MNKKIFKVINFFLPLIFCLLLIPFNNSIYPRVLYGLFFIWAVGSVFFLTPNILYYLGIFLPLGIGVYLLDLILKQSGWMLLVIDIMYLLPVLGFTLVLCVCKLLYLKAKTKQA